MKVLTPTRWFAGEEAVKRLRNQWKELIQSLLTIACDMWPKPVTQGEITSLESYTNTLETAMKITLWKSTLDRFQAVNRCL